MSFRVKWNAPRSSDWNKLVSVLGVCSLMSAGSAMAAVNAYLVVDGIDGSSTSRSHAIDVLSFSQGVSQAATTTTSTGAQRSAGKIDCSELTIEKQLDAASVPLLRAAFTGQMIQNVKLIYTKPVAAAATDYYTVTLTTVFVTSVQQAGSNENPSESVSFAAKTFTYSFTPQQADGSLGNPIIFSGSC